MISVGHLFFWRAGMCFGTFKVTDDVSQLRWFGPAKSEGTLIFLPGLIGSVVIALACACLLMSRSWRARRAIQLGMETSKILAAEEADWKARRLVEIQHWSPTIQQWHGSPALEELQLPPISEEPEIPDSCSAARGCDEVSLELHSVRPSFDPELSSSPSAPGKPYIVASERNLQSLSRSIGKPAWRQSSLGGQAKDQGSSSWPSSPEKPWLGQSPGSDTSWIGYCGCVSSSPSRRSEIWFQ